MKPILVFLLLFLATQKHNFGQHFLNGSFEINSSELCGINLTNASFNALMSNTKSIGIHESVDILNAEFCQYGVLWNAQSGSWFLGLDIGYDTLTSNIISLELSDSLNINNQYTLSYFDVAPLSTPEVLEIGLSLFESTFGDLIYTSPLPEIYTWTKREFSFLAPNSGKFITVRIKTAQLARWVNIDSFEISIGGSSAISFPNSFNRIELFPNPTKENFVVDLGKTYQQITITLKNVMGNIISSSDFTNVDKIHVNLNGWSPGLYFVEIKEDLRLVTLKIVKE
ncbi:MAG: T9SS type A sorting domain-containing protein [Bacteroidales bacterium]|nr:T9SS type A sorting domain-containing protein [Bacteroidales bacterium]MCF8456780.1 T9SS type A sorting domain-containing protein [Bacteroidales bacterium]